MWLGVLLMIVGAAGLALVGELHVRGIEAQLLSDMADMERDGWKTRARIARLSRPYIYVRSPDEDELPRHGVQAVLDPGARRGGFRGGGGDGLEPGPRHSSRRRSPDHLVVRPPEGRRHPH